MKGKRGNLKCKSIPNIYKQLGIIAAVVFAIYIIIKTIKTQQKKKIEGFKEGRRDIKRREGEVLPSETTQTTTTQSTGAPSTQNTGSPSTQVTTTTQATPAKTQSSGTATDEKKQISITIN